MLSCILCSYFQTVCATDCHIFKHCGYISYIPSVVVFRKVASSLSSLLVLDWIFSNWSGIVSSRTPVSKRLSQHNYHQCPAQITLPGLAGRYFLRMWRVAFRQMLCELSIAAICATTLSKSALLTHCCSAA